MKIRQWLYLSVAVMVAFAMTVGSGYWVYARQGHGMNEDGHMMKHGQHGEMMGEGHHKGKMKMPMMHANMSKEEMGQFCDRMQQRHKSMRKMRQKNTEKLNSLVQSMKQANGSEKIESMEKVLVELVEQQNKRGMMMKRSMHSMMGSMMGMHQMNSQKRQQMMQRMQDCPMMKGMMKSDSESDRENR